jgi:glutathione S-transferase
VTLQLYGHPFSSYTWKAEIALIEKRADYEFRMLGDDQPDNWETVRAAWPVGQFPFLIDDETTLFESSIIIEYLDGRLPGTPRLIPADPQTALKARLFDRVCDNHLQARFQAAVSEYIPFITDTPDLKRVARARDLLEKAYIWLETRIGESQWAVGNEFTLADCSAAPALFYADWTHPIDPRFAKLKAYRGRLLARPSVAECVERARPYRSYFPLGAPDRD